MAIAGLYYPENSSQAQSALMRFEQGYVILSVDSQVVCRSLVESLSVSERLGNMLRQVRFADGQLFETSANDAIDALLKNHQQQRFAGLLHLLESKLIYVAPLLMAATLVAWTSYTWGLPKLVHTAAFALPSSQLGLVGKGTLNILDESYLSPSQLNPATQAEITQRFDKLAQEIGSGFQYQLYFRRMPNNMPNAFALPDGSIVLMDGLVDITDHPWEIDSILLHEIGHVEQRHSLQMVLNDTFITLIVSMMFGDAISTTDAVAALPILLVENQYSQHFEQDSDDFATQYMLKHHIDTTHFASALQKLEASFTTQNTHPTHADEQANAPPHEPQKTSFWDYFSTHPDTQKRIQRIQERSLSQKQ